MIIPYVTCRMFSNGRFFFFGFLFFFLFSFFFVFFFFFYWRNDLFFSGDDRDILNEEVKTYL